MYERYPTPTRFRVPFAIRVLLWALLAAILAGAVSYSLRALNL